eukprot:m51a1_g8707 hypothetical protein (827) ;mRNA; r:113517-119446
MSDGEAQPATDADTRQQTAVVGSAYGWVSDDAALLPSPAPEGEQRQTVPVYGGSYGWLSDECDGAQPEGHAQCPLFGCAYGWIGGPAEADSINAPEPKHARPQVPHRQHDPATEEKLPAAPAPKASSAPSKYSSAPMSQSEEDAGRKPRESFEDWMSRKEREKQAHAEEQHALVHKAQENARRRLEDEDPALIAGDDVGFAPMDDPEAVSPDGGPLFGGTPPSMAVEPPAAAPPPSSSGLCSLSPRSPLSPRSAQQQQQQAPKPRKSARVKREASSPPGQGQGQGQLLAVPGKPRSRSRGGSPTQTPVMSAPAEPRKVAVDLARIAATYEDRHALVCAMRGQQAAAAAAGDAGQLRALALAQEAVRQDLEHVGRALRNLETTQLLLPPELARIAALEQGLAVDAEQLRLYGAELALLAAPPAQQQQQTCVASLVIAEQSFPRIIGQRKTGDPDEQVVLRVLTGAVQPVQVAAPVEPEMVTDAKSKAPTESIVEKEAEQPDPADPHTVRVQLAMRNGSRKAPIAVKFSTVVHYPGGSVVLQSQVSNPFVVITNECQYQVSDGSLLKRVAFGNQKEIGWIAFANMLQRHFVRAMRQDPTQPARYLSRREMIYFHDKFFGRGPTITAAQFDKFWDWFGQALQKLRYTRHISNLWREGLLWGFTGRQDIESALIGQPPGTFAIRFSERNAGLFAATYAVNDVAEPVRHYLVKPDELTTQRTLPDFLGETPQFLCILRVHFDDEGGFSTVPVVKDEVLASYYNKKERIKVQQDYDATVSTMPMLMAGLSLNASAAAGRPGGSPSERSPPQMPQGFASPQARVFQPPAGVNM